MHHLKNKNTKTMYYIIYILSVYSCSSDMYAHTRARNECVCVTLTNQRCLLRTCSLSIRTFVHSKASKDFRKDSKASAGSTPKRSDLFQALERSSKFIKAIRSRRMKYESFCWTSTLNQDFQDLPGPQRSFAAKVPSNFSSGWFKELVRINVCSTRSSSSSLALGHQAVSGRLIDCDCLRTLQPASSTVTVPASEALSCSASFKDMWRANLSRFDLQGQSQLLYRPHSLPISNF